MTGPWVEPWTEAELAVVRQCAMECSQATISDDWRHEAASRLPGRSYYAVKKIARDKKIHARGYKRPRLKDWTREEEDVIRSHARRADPEEPARSWQIEAATKLDGRTVNAVKARALYLGITRETPDGTRTVEEASARRKLTMSRVRGEWKSRPWSWMEDSVIRTTARRSTGEDGIPKRGWLMTASTMLSERTYGAVCWRAAYLGLRTYGLTPGPVAPKTLQRRTRAGRHLGTWTEDEDNLLRELYDASDSSEWFQVAYERLDGRRTYRAVRERARNLGLTDKPSAVRWTPEEDAILKEAAALPGNGPNWVRDIAPMFENRSFHGVRNRANRLGLTDRNPFSDFGKSDAPSFGGLAETSLGKTAPKRSSEETPTFVINAEKAAGRAKEDAKERPKSKWSKGGHKVSATPVDCDDETTVIGAEVVALFEGLAENEAKTLSRGKAAMRELARQYGDNEYLDTDEEVLYGHAA